MKKHGLYYLYIVQCKNGTYYTGYTNDLENRLEKHNSGKGAKYLRGKHPIKLVYKKEYRYLRSVLRAEWKLKKLTKEEKTKLIRSSKVKF